MSNISVWDGDYNNLPPKEFSFNGQAYTWELCDCGCERPLGYKNGEHDFEMTVRLRGNNQGDPMATVLVKLGKMEELIAAGREHMSVATLLDKTLFELLPLPTAPEFDEALEKYGINEVELIFATGEAAGIPEELTQLVLLAGLDDSLGFDGNARQN